MRTKTLKKVEIKMWESIEACQTPLFLSGPRSNGKSKTTYLAAQFLKRPLSILRTGSKGDVGDFYGSPMVKDGITQYAPPVWYTIVNVPDGGFLFFDEFNRTEDMSLIGACMELFEDHRFNEFVLPKRVVKIVAINPTTKDRKYRVADLTDAALVDRFCAVKIQLTKDEMVEYFLEEYEEELGHKIPQVMKDFIVIGQDKVAMGDQSFELPKKDFSTRGIRQFISMWDVITAIPEAADELITGCVGGIGLQVWKQMDILKSIPLADAYFKDPKIYDVKGAAKEALSDESGTGSLKLRAFLHRVREHLKDATATKPMVDKVTYLTSQLPDIWLGLFARWTLQTKYMARFVDNENAGLTKKCVDLHRSQKAVQEGDELPDAIKQLGEAMEKVAGDKETQKAVKQAMKPPTKTTP